MASEWSRSFDTPDEVIDEHFVVERVIRVANATVGRFTIKPGFRWTVHVGPHAGTELCQVRHVGFSLAGRMRIRLADGSEYDIEAGEVFLIPPGHDIWVIGDAPAETVEWAGVLGWHPGPEGRGRRVLATMLLCDIVESTATAERLGAARWAELLAEHDETASDVISRHHGRVVKGTGDGVLATFASARNAVDAARALAEAIEPLGLQIRIGLHTGEIDVTYDDIVGAAVNELARITDLAGGGEVLVSDATVSLVGPAQTFEERGDHRLRGFEAARGVFALVR